MKQLNINDVERVLKAVIDLSINGNEQEKKISNICLKSPENMASMIKKYGHIILQK